MNGMVLSAMPAGEYDKRLTILTVERGKISAFARGARRPNSSLLACSQPFSYGEFTAYAGRDSYTVTNAQVSNYFPRLKEDLEKVYLGMYFCECADYFAREGNDERELLKLLYQSLRALESGKFPLSLVRRIFELKLISIEGEAPQVSSCIFCGKKGEEELNFFALHKDGVVCSSCAKRLAEKMISVSPACLYAMQYVVGTSCAQLYRFSLKEDVLIEFGALVEEYIKKHIGRKMKSLQVLETMGFAKEDKKDPENFAKSKEE